MILVCLVIFAVILYCSESKRIQRSLQKGGVEPAVLIVAGITVFILLVGLLIWFLTRDKSSPTPAPTPTSTQGTRNTHNLQQGATPPSVTPEDPNLHDDPVDPQNPQTPLDDPVDPQNPQTPLDDPDDPQNPQTPLDDPDDPQNPQTPPDDPVDPQNPQTNINNSVNPPQQNQQTTVAPVDTSSPFTSPCTYSQVVADTITNHCQSESVGMDFNNGVFTTDACSQRCYNALVWGEGCSNFSPDQLPMLQNSKEYCKRVSPNLIEPTCDATSTYSSSLTACANEEQTRYQTCSQSCLDSLITLQQCPNFPEDFSTIADTINSKVQQCQSNLNTQ